MCTGIQNRTLGQIIKKKVISTINYYITHKNIPVILLVNTTSRDIKYYAYFPDIWREGNKLL